MSIFSRGKHGRHSAPAQTGRPPARKFPPRIQMTAPPAAPPVLQDTVAFPAPEPRPFSRPYPGRRGTQAPWPGRPHFPPQSDVRDGVLLTSRASSFRFPLECACGSAHRNANADTFRDLYISAEWAGWRQDRYSRVWRCPRCVRRHQAVFGVPPVAAIEAGAA
jgi:hypothetical protein